MSGQGRAGVRAARALLSLVEESSVEELRAAESILGPKELVEALQILRRFKEHEQMAPLSLERLREIVRVELEALPLSVDDIALIAALLSLRWSLPPAGSELGRAWDQLLSAIDAASPSPRQQADTYVHLLLLGANRAGPEHLAKTLTLLRDLAIHALTGNVVFFPTLSSLAELRTRWSEAPLPHSRGESRRDLTTRLLADAERKELGDFAKIVADLLVEGLRSPTDGAAIAMRGQKAKKAHGA